MTQQEPIRNILIVGGGTAGWMTAAAMATILKTVKIELVESDEIGIIGVGEATIPPIQAYNRMLGIDENEFVRATEATYKLGIEFVNWQRQGHSYLHPFGSYGVPIDATDFHHYWLKANNDGYAGDIDDYSVNAQLARAKRFARPGKQPATSPLARLSYAFHFDASLYASYLSNLAKARGVTRHEGRVLAAELDSDSGHVTHVVLEDGRALKADLFIDCSGFRGLLIEQTLKVGYTDWSHWLPCNSALAVPSAKIEEPIPYTRSTAQAAGWTWRIPLQHRTGNGYVYSSTHISDSEAEQTLMTAIDGAPLADPRLIRFTTGRRNKLWEKNVVAIGLSSGFLEPLESTSIHLVQSAIGRLLNLFPSRRFEQPLIDQYNRMGMVEIENIRDFLILHYAANNRDNDPFWQERKTIGFTPSLENKVNLFRAAGQLKRREEDLFSITSWLAVLLGQGIYPEGYSALVDQTDPNKIREILAMLRQQTAQAAQALPLHTDFLASIKGNP